MSDIVKKADETTHVVEGASGFGRELLEEAVAELSVIDGDIRVLKQLIAMARRSLDESERRLFEMEDHRLKKVDAMKRLLASMDDVP